MNSFTKKYLKFALIIFVIGIIISIIAFSLGGRIVDLPTRNLTNISQSYTGVESLNIDIGMSELEIKTGTEFKIEANNVSIDTFKSSVQNGQWDIEDKMSSKLFNINKYNTIVTIYIPESFNSEKIKINIGAGQLIVDKLAASSIDINVGAGNLKISNLTTDEANIECGAGNIDISGKINNKSNIKCGMGNVNLELKGNEKDYNYNLTVGVGEITLNGNNFTGLGNKVIENISASKSLKIDCGVGKLNVNIKY